MVFYTHVWNNTLSGITKRLKKPKGSKILAATFRSDLRLAGKLHVFSKIKHEVISLSVPKKQVVLKETFFLYNPVD